MSDLEILKRLFREYTKQYIGKIFLSVFFSVLVAGSTSAIAYLLDPAIEKIFIEKNKQLMLLIPFTIVFFFSIKGLSLFLAKTILIRVAGEIMKKLQLQIMQSTLSSNIETVDSKHSGKIISHALYDASIMKNLVSSTILLATKESMTLVGLICVMFYQNWKLALFALIMIPLASVAVKSLGKRVGKITTQAQEVAGEVNSFFLDIIKNHKIIKIFQREDYESNRLDKVINKIKEKSVKTDVVMMRSTPIMETLTGIMIGGLIFYAGSLIINNDLEINNFFSFLAAMMLAYQPVRSLATINMGIHSGLSAAKRVLPIIDSKIIDKNEGKNIDLKKGDINFKNVSFKYKSRKDIILNKINLNINSGEMTALVGHSGAGKSTIMNLIPRFYELSEGEILIDEQSINNFSVNSLRKNISLVSQDTTLFDDTIKNNIKYSNLEASNEEVINAAKLSHCDDFINNMPDGYDTMVGENGVRLSGGEKQRISIARAILKDSSIILMDEATSSLDSETEEKIQNAIAYLTKGKTTLVIAHRLSTVINSNKIYVIEKGKVAAEGNHEELIKSSEIYKNFYEIQLHKKDENNL